VAFVPGFDYDVFVSYAHADNELPIGTEARYGWVTALTHNLSSGANRLKKNLFIDHQLKPGDPFSEDLRNKVARSALLLIFLSQHYAESAWCGLELDHFIWTHSDNPAKPRQVVVVELCPYERLTAVPNNIANLRKELIQAQFWYVTPDAIFSRLAGYPSPKENDYGGYYWRQLDCLCHALDTRLGELKAQVTQPEKFSGGNTDKSSQSSAKASPAVLLADVTDDLVPQRNEVKLALEKEGIHVLPEGDYVGRSVAEIQLAFTQDARNSLLFVQLLSATIGRIPDGGEYPLPQLQFAASQVAALPILQWCQTVPEVNTIADPRHDALFRTAFLSTVNLERFKDEVISKYRDLQAPRKTRTPDAAAVQTPKGKCVFVDDRLGDQELHAQIRSVIERANCEIRYPPPDASLEQDDAFMEDLLRPCRGGITVYTDRRDHKATYFRLVRFLNRIAAGRIALSRWGVYLGPPPDKQDLLSEFRLSSQALIPIAGMHGLNEAALVEFLQNL
jgi:hypothetical protein